MLQGKGKPRFSMTGPGRRPHSGNKNNVFPARIAAFIQHISSILPLRHPQPPLQPMPPIITRLNQALIGRPAGPIPEKTGLSPGKTGLRPVLAIISRTGNPRRGGFFLNCPVSSRKRPDSPRGYPCQEYHSRSLPAQSGIPPTETLHLHDLYGQSYDPVSPLFRSNTSQRMPQSLK